MDNNNEIVIIYHKEDNDGVGSAALIKNMLLKRDEDNIVMIGADHKDIERMCADKDYVKSFKKCKELYVTDIALTPTLMAELAKNEKTKKKTYWFDHHAPMIEMSETMGFSGMLGYRNANHSAIMNVWEYYYSKTPSVYCISTLDCPPIIKAVSAIDNWTWQKEGYKLEDVDSISLGINAMSDLSITWWMNNMEAILDHYDSYKTIMLMGDIYKLGSKIREDRVRKNLDMCNNGADMSWTVNNERSAAAIVLYGGSSSLMFSSLADAVDNGIVLRRASDGTWRISLYNVKDDSNFHCGKYLEEKYGGGGHEGAAGCTLSEEQFITVLKSKNL